MKIKSIEANEILDSRGFPTVWAGVSLEDGSFGQASVPSGASVGKFEAVELRDGTPRLGGKGVQKAVEHVKGPIASAMVGKEFSAQAHVDRFLCRLDATRNKQELGANAILAVSMAAARAYAKSMRLPLYEYLARSSGRYFMPMPMMNLLNGGMHADNNVEMQEFMVLPMRAKSFREALMMGAEVYHALKSELKQMGRSTAVGDEGGFAPDLRKDEEAIQFLLQAMERAGVTKHMAIGIDAAVSHWYAQDGQYCLPKSRRKLSREEMISFYQDLVRQYPICSLEDGMAEEDYEGFALLTKALPIQIVGDDLFVTNSRRIQFGIQNHLANSVLIKMNQIGTVFEAQEAIALAREAGYSAIVSHRSGETEDAFLADFAVAMGSGQIKTGAPCRGERTAKYNRLLRIEEELGNHCEYLGGAVLSGWHAD